MKKDGLSATVLKKRTSSVMYSKASGRDHHDQGQALGHGPEEEGDREDVVEDAKRRGHLKVGRADGHGPS